MRHVSPDVVVEAEGVRTIHRAPLSGVSMRACLGAGVGNSKPAHLIVFVTTIELAVVHVLRVSDTTCVLVKIVVKVFVVLRGAEAPARGAQTVVVRYAQVAAVAVAHSLDTAERTIRNRARVNRGSQRTRTCDG